VVPCATGDENYIGGAVETVEGIRLIKQELPDARTILGISNVSFGLPASAREVMNSFFLYYYTKARLDLAIVNTEKLERFASIQRIILSLSCYAMFRRIGANKRKSSTRRSINVTSPLLRTISGQQRRRRKNLRQTWC